MALDERERFRRAQPVLERVKAVAVAFWEDERGELLTAIVTALITAAVGAFIAYIFRPKPEPPDPADASQFTLPRVDEGTEIGRVYGTVWINSPRVHWFGDYDNEAIKDKQGKK